MADNQLGTEVVTFEAIGLDELILTTEKAKKTILEAYTAQLGMNKALSDPAVLKASQEAARLSKANRDLLDTTLKLTKADQDRQAIAERRERFRSGAALSDMRLSDRGSMASRIADLREQRQYRESGALSANARRSTGLDLVAGREGLADRRALLASGNYSASIRNREMLRLEADAVARAERRTELQTLHGSTLGGLMYGAERARPALLAAGATAAGLAAGPIGMARSGLSGTVEGNVLSHEMQLLNREIAATLVPVLKDLTRAIRYVRDQFQGLSEHQQKAIGYGIAGTAAIGAGGVALAGIGSALSGLAALKSVFGGRAAQTVVGSLVQSAGSQAAGTAVANSIAPAAGGAVAGGAGSSIAKGNSIAKGASRGGLAGRGATLAGVIAAALSGYDEYERYSSTGLTARNILNTTLKAFDLVPGASYAREGLDKTLGKMGFSGGSESGKSGGHMSLTPAVTGYIDAEQAYKDVQLSGDTMEWDRLQARDGADGSFAKGIGDLIREQQETNRLLRERGQPGQPLQRPQ